MKHTICTLDRPKRAVITSKYYIGPLYKTATHTLLCLKMLQLFYTTLPGGRSWWFIPRHCRSQDA